jgi:hypothetical protein
MAYRHAFPPTQGVLNISVYAYNNNKKNQETSQKNPYYWHLLNSEKIWSPASSNIREAYIE